MEFRRVLFFFQAEDGIRDDLVTGVQTCALPIWPETPTMMMVSHSELTNSSSIISEKFSNIAQSLVETIDRKSTRLNSSHQIISYAVFCLKKKNNKRQKHTTPKTYAHIESLLSHL